MRRTDILPAECYLVKVSGRLCPVRVDFIHPVTKKYICTNLATGRRILCTAQRIGAPLSKEEAVKLAEKLKTARQRNKAAK
ncbi:hypothetical protein [Thermogutta sp.]|jgi:hypothetical protein|uniref:hypothetical protein n=1 Tax=Thermogutta sp. TaxID=1962930 RepID=UPI0032204311